MNVQERTRDHTTWRGSGRARRREIRVGSNYKTPGNAFAPSAPGLEQAQGAPPDWAGFWDFSFAGLNAPLQTFARDSMDVGNRAMVGCRLSDRPQSWWNLKAMNVNPVDAFVSEDGLTITYAGLWDGCDLVFEVQGMRLVKRIVIWDKSIAPPHFEFTVQYGQGHDFAVSGGSMRLSQDGIDYLRTDIPWGKDSATTGLGPDGENQIPTTLTEQAPVAGRPVVRITPDPVAMASAFGTVTIDPTSVISGSASLQDAMILSGGNADKNYGSRADFVFKNNGTQKSLLRVLTSALPIGTYNTVDIDVYPNAGSTIASESRRVLPGNSWVEGTSNGVIESGAVCWNYPTYNAPPWNGTAGCSTPHVDYQDDNVCTFGSYTSGVWATENCTAAGVANFQGWVDGTYANEGFVLGFSGASTAQLRLSSQQGTNPWFVTIDYDELVGGLPRLGRGRGIFRGAFRGV